MLGLFASRIDNDVVAPNCGQMGKGVGIHKLLERLEGTMQEFKAGTTNGFQTCVAG